MAVPDGWRLDYGLLSLLTHLFHSVRFFHSNHPWTHPLGPSSASSALPASLPFGLDLPPLHTGTTRAFQFGSASVRPHVVRSTAPVKAGLVRKDQGRRGVRPAFAEDLTGETAL